MKKTISYALMFGLSCAVAMPLMAQETKAVAPTTAPAVDPQKVVLQVGGDKMTAQQFNDFVSDLPEQSQQMVRGPGKRMVAEKIVELKLMSAEAQRQKLDQLPKVQRQLQMARESILTSALAENVQKSANDAVLKKYFEDHKAEFEQVKARHILIRAAGSPVPLGEGKKDLTDEQAKAKATEIRERLVKGEDFAKVAKAESDDQGSGAQGGSLGSFGRGQMVGPFEDAAFALKEGEISQLVKTPFGYHVIQVQEHKAPTFEQAKEEIASRVGPEQLDKLLADLKKGDSVKIDDAFFGPARPAVMGMPAGHP